MSSKGQDLDIQLERLRAVGCEEVYSEKQTGTGARALAERDRVVAALQPGDTLCVTKIDRLGRSMAQIVLLIEELLARGVAVQLVDQGITYGGATDDPYQRAFRGMLAMMAQLERDLIVDRLADGRAHSGNQGGRKPKLTEKHMDDIKALVAAGRPIAQIAKTLGVGRKTVYSLIERHGGLDALEDGRDPRRPNGPWGGKKEVQS